ncbi:polyisoprenoid-binding protein YceI [Thermocatellispora tengchongensis]|uniref:Polyisoprenoid-binding protein YceI n=1 Tax=Thermocatellispora tengchongensis TaxID=1073253 RepID=A0A840PRQ3_9ACTN|nr:hypothetical protein [Thermocatellispora tengchongensis]MBB5140431.1 polyisoprenoid-binding protein YceI [Thermocatellispora tengchongensis]
MNGFGRAMAAALLVLGTGLAGGGPAQAAGVTAQAEWVSGDRPLWPFTSLEQARAWQRLREVTGDGSWHLDPGRTALAFTRRHLGFTGVDVEVGRSVKGRTALVKVGYRHAESDKPGVAATIRLVRLGTGPGAPWAVVGTDDDTLTITRPAYGASVRSPLTVSGRITGVDESLRVRALVRGADRPAGSTCCEPAGGENASWRVRLSFRAAPGTLMTLVVSTGGHVAEVERFAVTAVRAAG